MAIFIPHRWPKCFESVTLIQPQHKGGAFKGPARGQAPCLLFLLSVFVGTATRRLLRRPDRTVHGISGGSVQTDTPARREGRYCPWYPARRTGPGAIARGIV